MALPYMEVGNEVPAASHLYQSISYIPRTLGGGANGSYLKMGSFFAGFSATRDVIGSGHGAHAMDLTSGKWKRLTNDVFSNDSYDFYGGQVTVFDGDKRFYILDASLHSKNGKLSDGTSIANKLVYLEY